MNEEVIDSYSPSPRMSAGLVLFGLISLVMVGLAVERLAVQDYTSGLIALPIAIAMLWFVLSGYRNLKEKQEFILTPTHFIFRRVQEEARYSLAEIHEIKETLIGGGEGAMGAYKITIGHPKRTFWLNPNDDHANDFVKSLIQVRGQQLES